MLEGLKAFCSVSSVGAVHERHVQLERRVDDKAFVMEYLAYMDEQRFGPRQTNPYDVGTTAGFPLEDVEGVEGDHRGRVCKREECLETVKEVQRSWERFRGEVHDAEGEVHTLRACEEGRVWCRKIEAWP